MRKGFNLSQIISKTETQKLQLDGKVSVLHSTPLSPALSTILIKVLVPMNNSCLPGCVTAVLTIWVNAKITTWTPKFYSGKRLWHSWRIHSDTWVLRNVLGPPSWDIAFLRCSKGRAIDLQLHLLNLATWNGDKNQDVAKCQGVVNEAASGLGLTHAWIRVSVTAWIVSQVQPLFTTQQSIPALHTQLKWV